MSLENDPHSRSLRALITNSLRYGRPEEAEEYRQALRIENIKRALVKNLQDAPALSALQVRELRREIETYGPQALRRSA